MVRWKRAAVHNFNINIINFSKKKLIRTILGLFIKFAKDITNLILSYIFD